MLLSAAPLQFSFKNFNFFLIEYSIDLSELSLKGSPEFPPETALGNFWDKSDFFSDDASGTSPAIPTEITSEFIP